MVYFSGMQSSGCLLLSSHRQLCSTMPQVHTSDLFNIWRNFYVLIALSDHMIFHQDPLTHPWLRSYLQTTGHIKVKLFFKKFTESNLNPISCSCADNVWGPEADGGFVEAVRLCGKTCGSSEVSWSLVVRLMIQAIVTEFGEIMVVFPSTSEMLIVSGGAISNLATMSTITTKRLLISADHIRISILTLAFRWRRPVKVEVAVPHPLLLLLQAQLLNPLLLSDHPADHQGKILCDQSDDRWSVCVISDPKPRPFAAFRLCYRIHSKAFTRTVYY